MKKPALKYFCEYCKTKFHTPASSCECTRLPICRGMGFPPKAVSQSWKVRGCALILANTAADLLLKSPAAAHHARVVELGRNIKKWTVRLYDALQANTPISLGKATRLHNDLVEYTFAHVWNKGAPLPNIHALDLAARYADAARAYVEERIENGENKTFWFQAEHAEWMLHNAVSMPLAVYITKMKGRRHTSKELDQLIVSWGERDYDATGEDKPATILEKMLEHSWQDEVRSWRYLESALEMAQRWIRDNGTEASLDLTNYDTDLAFEKLLAHIWEEEVEKPKTSMKPWLINGVHLVAAGTRQGAKGVYELATGKKSISVRGVDVRTKVYDDKRESLGTVGEIMERYYNPQMIGSAE